jgi:hypothetical protein
MKSIFSKAVTAAVIAACFTLNVQASSYIPAIDTGKMSKMDHKMDKKMDKKMKKKGKMAKDTTSKM